MDKNTAKAICKRVLEASALASQAGLVEDLADPQVFRAQFLIFAQPLGNGEGERAAGAYPSLFTSVEEAKQRGHRGRSLADTAMAAISAR